MEEKKKERKKKPWLQLNQTGKEPGKDVLCDGYKECEEEKTKQETPMSS
jgi:hypothetical protein